MGGIGEGSGHTLGAGEKVVGAGWQAGGQDGERRANGDIKGGFDCRGILAGVKRTGVDGLTL